MSTHYKTLDEKAESQKRWDEYFSGMAHFVATKSKDPSTKCGAVIVGSHNEIRSTGYNGLPQGVNDDAPERWKRPEKYYWVVHAEMNAILNAARMGTPLDGCRMYVTHYPCSECAKAIIRAGIQRVYMSNEGDMSCDSFCKRWHKQNSRAEDMFREAGVDLLVFYDCKEPTE